MINDESKRARAKTATQCVCSCDCRAIATGPKTSDLQSLITDLEINYFSQGICICNWKLNISAGGSVTVIGN